MLSLTCYRWADCNLHHMASALYERIYEAVRQVPYGHVATYGQIAERCGMPLGAQVVGWALRALPPGSDVPWPRIVAKGGRITISNPLHPPTEQKELLEAEGAVFQEQASEYQLVKPKWY